MNNKLAQDFFIFVGGFILLGILWFATGGGHEAARQAVNPIVIDSNGHIVPEAGGSSASTTAQGVPGLVIAGGGSGSGGSSGGNGSGAGNGNGSGANATSSNPNLSDSHYAWIKNKSPYFREVTLQIGNIYSGSAAQQYLVLNVSNSNKAPIGITGWQLMSTSTGAVATIGKAIVLPGLSSVDYAEPLSLAPGATVYVVSGRSPAGISFQSNKCMGWYAQANTFIPSLPYSCPRIADDPLPQAPNALTDQCLDYLRGINGCQIPNSIPEYLPHECQQFIADHSTYNSCIAYHKSDSDFYTNHWWVYLNYDQPLWKSERETIELLDQNGKVVDLVSYNYY